jgi:hypothetical protein
MECVIEQLTVETCVENIRDIIDEKHLKIAKDVCLRSLQGACISWCRNQYLTYKKATTEMQQIESYIPSNMQNNNRMRVLDTLVVKHWYVNYLIQALVRQKSNEFENVTGFTIDTLYCGAQSCSVRDENIVEKSVSHEAWNVFFDNIEKKRLIDIMPRILDDIHFTVLYGNSAIKSSSLMISSDSKYVRATDDTKSYMIWDTETGETVDSAQIASQNIAWVSGHMYADDRKNSAFGVYGNTLEEGYRVINTTDTYCAITTHPDMVINGEFFSKAIARNRKAIILFKRPQMVSYLCQKAFNNSYLRSNELLQLSQSDTFKAIEGFPRKNLERFIENRRKKLAS